MSKSTDYRKLSASELIDTINKLVTRKYELDSIIDANQLWYNKELEAKDKVINCRDYDIKRLITYAEDRDVEIAKVNRASRAKDKRIAELEMEIKADDKNVNDLMDQVDSLGKRNV